MTPNHDRAVSFRHVAILLGVITLVIVPTGAAMVNAGMIDFLGEESGLALSAADGPNGEYVEFNAEDQLSVNISSEGVNMGAVTTFDRVFIINNTGTEVREVWINHTNSEILSLYDTDTGQAIGFEKRVTLASSEQIAVGIKVDLQDEDVSIGQSIEAVLTIHSRDLSPEDGPEIGVPERIEFGDVTNGTIATKSVTIDNDGAAPMALNGVSISGTDAGSFSLADAGNLPDVIGPGESVTFGVEALPERTGSHSASLVVSSNGSATGTTSVPITMNSVPEQLTVVTGDRLGFGEVEIDTASQRTVTLRNDGSTTVEISDLRLSGADAGSFTAVEAGVLGDVAPDESVDVTIVFSPDRTGSHSASLEVQTAGGSEPVTVVLTGTGIVPADIRLEPTVVDFGDVAKNGHANATITIANDGEEPLTITGHSLRGADADQFAIRNSVAGTTIAGGESRTVTVEFNPTRNGELTGSLRVTSSDGDTPVRTVSLTGNSVPATVHVDPEHLKFTNGVYTLEVLVWNDENSLGDLRIGTTSLFGRDPDAFEITSGQAPFTLSPGEERSVEVTFTPPSETGQDGSLAIRTAQLRILSDGDPEQIDVWVSNTDWRIRIQEVKPGGRSIDAEDEGFNLDTTRIKQTASNVEVDLDDLPENTEIDVNVSSPGTRDRSAGIQEVNFRANRGGSFDMNFVHDDEPPLDDSVSYTPNTGEGISQYVTLYHSQENDAFTNPSLVFRVNRANLEPGTDADEVVFRRYEDGQWVSYDLTLLRSSATHYVYRVNLPGFSEFVITSPASEESGDGSGGGGAGGGGGTGGGLPPGETPTEPEVVDLPSGEAVQVSFDEDQGGEIVVTELESIPGTDAAPLAAIDLTAVDGDAEAGIEAEQPSPEIQERIRAAGADALVQVGQTLRLSGAPSVIRDSEGIDGQGRIVRAVDISVPEDRRDQPATIRLTVDRGRFGESDPSRAQMGHYTGEGWQILPTEVVSVTADTVTVEARTPGFSPFAVFAANQVQFTWELPDGTTIEGVEIEPAFEEPGFHNVSLTVTDAFGRSDTSTYRILANDEPDVEIVAPESIEPGETVTLRADIENEVGNVTATWQFSDGTEQTGLNVTRSFDAGTRDVRVVVTDEFGASAEAQTTLPVGPTFGAQQLRSVAASMPFEAQVLLSFLIAVTLTFAASRLFGSGGTGWLSGISIPAIPFRRSHPPEVLDFADARLDRDGGEFVVGRLSIRDPEEDLKSVALEVRNDRGALVARRILDPTSEEVYEASDVAVPGLSRVYLMDDGGFEITLIALDGRGDEARSQLRLEGSG